MPKPHKHPLFEVKIKYWLLSFCLIITSACSTVSPLDTTLAPINLKVGEGFIEPIGYYESKPRFSWQINTKSKQKNQTAYQIQVAQTPDFSKQTLLWDSAKTKAEQTAWIKYQGQNLVSRQTVYWRVRSWSENNKVSRWSQAHSIELGLLHNNDWQAKWIGHPDTNERLKQVKINGFADIDRAFYRPQYLRQTFNVEKQIKKACLYITAKGVFKPYINNQSIHLCIKPMFTDFGQPGLKAYVKNKVSTA